AIVAIIPITLEYIKWYRILNYWSKRNISGPKPIPYVGNMLSLALNARPVVDMDWYKTYGKTHGFYEWGAPILTVSDPELIKQILVKDFYKFRNRRPVPGKGTGIFSKTMLTARDDQWKRIRAIASPTFSSYKLKRLYPLINECCRDFLAALDRDVSTGRTEVDLKLVMGAYSMDVIASTAFATKTNPYFSANNPFVMKANRVMKIVFSLITWQTFVAMILPTFLTKTPAWKRVAKGVQSNATFFIDVVQRLMSERKKSDKKRNDFMQLLMDVKREDNNNTTTTTTGAGDAMSGHHVNEGIDELMAEKQALSGVVEKKLTEAEIIAQCLLFFVAGYETTATTLAYCLYELALNPDIQDLLVAETREAFNENTADIDYETLCRLPLLDAVISETLRHYPVGLRPMREAMEDVVLCNGNDGSTIKIDKGLIVELPLYAIHHDEDYYPDPFAFKPDRFLPENRHNIKPYTYLPFGSGPRNCIGMRFAMLSMKLVVAKMVQQFRVYRVPDTDVPVVFTPGRNLLMPDRLVVGVAKR
ncbi:unnamed protein product, partial [Medioppia subpectinata]